MHAHVCIYSCSLCMHPCIHMRIHHMCAHTCILTHSHAHSWTHTHGLCTHTCTPTHAHPLTHLNMHTLHIRANARSCMCRHDAPIQTHMHTLLHTHAHPQPTGISVFYQARLHFLSGSCRSEGAPGRSCPIPGLQFVKWAGPGLCLDALALGPLWGE